MENSKGVHGTAKAKKTKETELVNLTLAAWYEESRPGQIDLLGSFLTLFNKTITIF
jgi:hypothetical protein